MIEFGEFLDGHGRSAEAQAWYQRARDQIVIDRSNGVRPDAALIFFEADHGQAVDALAQAEAAVAARPFFELHEAHAWALYKNGRFDDAADAIERATVLGIRDPELYVRSALIQFSLGDNDAARADLATATEINPLGVPYLDQADHDLLTGITAEN
jgi:tetratricopeptide (TPR) repeat protein